MYQLKREAGFSPSNSRETVQKLVYVYADGPRIKLHVRRPEAKDQSRLSGSNVFILSASIVQEDHKVRSLRGIPMIMRDHHANIQMGLGATLADRQAKLLWQEPEQPPETDDYLLASRSETGIAVKRYDGQAWQDWLDLPATASDAEIFMASDLEFCFRQAVMQALDEAQLTEAIDSLVPGL